MPFSVFLVKYLLLQPYTLEIHVLIYYLNSEVEKLEDCLRHFL